MADDGGSRSRSGADTVGWLDWPNRCLLPIPIPLGRGEPAAGYPHPWSVHRWLDGEPATVDRIIDPRRLAIDLAGFLSALRNVDPTAGPQPGVHNWYRGGPLRVWDGSTREALAAVIDFGTCGVGDPVRDLAIAWTLLTGSSRQEFREHMAVDSGEWSRGRGWALWRALTTCASSLAPDRSDDFARARRVVDEIIADHVA